MYDERSAPHGQAANGSAERITFRNVLAFENFILLMGVVFGLQFVDRSFGPVLPLYVAELGTPAARVPIAAGVLFSIAAGAGAVGHHFCGRLLRRADGAARDRGQRRHRGGRRARSTCSRAARGCSCSATPIFGLAIGVATTAAYTAASSVMPASARGAGFGLLTTASLTGLALSPIVSGILGATSIRAVFLLDTVGLVALAVAVSRLMIAAPLADRDAPATEEL